MPPSITERTRARGLDREEIAGDWIAPRHGGHGLVDRLGDDTEHVGNRLDERRQHIVVVGGGRTRAI
jgi:hypothetical protein